MSSLPKTEPMPAASQSWMLIFARMVILSVGLLLPLHLPFAIQSSRVGSEKVLGWWTSPKPDSPDGAQHVVTRTGWHARAAGLRPGDVIVRIDGRVADARTLSRARQAAAPGDVIALGVERNDQVVRLRVRVTDGSTSYALYRWYRLFLALFAWGVGMAMVAWHAKQPEEVALAAALVLIAPVSFPVAVPSLDLSIIAANHVWQIAAGAYRFFFPALLLGFLVLHAPHPWLLQLRRYAWVACLPLFGILAAVTDLFRDPVAWAVPGLAREVRTAAGVFFEFLALGGVLAIRSPRIARSGSVRWVAFVVLLLMGVGTLLSLAMLAVPEHGHFIDILRQVKSLAMLLLPVAAALYLLNRGGAQREWAKRRRISSSFSMLLIALYAFAVAGTAAIVLSWLGRSLGGAEWILFSAIFLATIVFSPVLRWTRELVDRRTYSQWMALEMRAHLFADAISAELEPERIAERIEREAPPLLDASEAELIIAREIGDKWDVPAARPLIQLPRDAIADHMATRSGEDPTEIVPVYCPSGTLMGAIRYTHRRTGDELAPSERAILRTLARGVAAAIRNADSYFKLRRAEQELAEGERIAALGALAGGLAHEIKNPLASLKMGLHLMKDGKADADKLARIESDVRRIDDLVSSLLRFTQDGDWDEPEPVELRALASACVGDLAPLAEDRGVKIIERYPKHETTAMGGRSQLRLVMSALLRNAIDAVHEGDVVEIALAILPGDVELSIHDTGPGIPEELQRRIFDVNFSTKAEGTGLGLALARRETEKLGGRIEIHSGSGRGTLLRVRLPRAI